MVNDLNCSIKFYIDGLEVINKIDLVKESIFCFEDKFKLFIGREVDYVKCF